MHVSWGDASCAGLTGGCARHHLGSMSEKKVAIVTGAGKGIGRATALVLSREGYRVTVMSRTRADLESLRDEIGGKDACLVYVGDVGDVDSAADCVAQTEACWDRVDLLVNNAGYGVSAPVHEFRVKDWDGMMSANVRGTFLMTRAVLPGMMERNDGTIVNIASIAGLNGFVGGTGYAASKHAVIGFTDSLWREVREYNIRVCAICPGSVDTHFFGDDVGGPGREHMMRSEDIANAVLYAARQPDRLFVRQIELRVTHPKK